MLTPGWSSDAITHQGHVRSENQDAYLSDDENQLWLVADGMGGGKGGALASRMLRQTFENICLEEELTQRVNQLEQLVFNANLKIYHYARESFCGDYMGTTLVLLNRWHNLGILIWAGDSRCYGQDATRLQCLTWDHNQATELMKLGQMSEQEMRQLPKSHAITRAVGLHPDLCLEFQLLDMANWRLFLLCSDGIYGEVSQALMFNCFAANGSMKHKTALLRDKVLQAGAHDNLTLICIYPDQFAKTAVVKHSLTQWNRQLEKLQLDYYLAGISRDTLVTQRQQLLSSIADNLSWNPTREMNSEQTQALCQVSELKRSKNDPVYLFFIATILIILFIFMTTIFIVTAAR
ncbi:serine/threonine-protein phosphatase [Thalassomonas viridans]|uniref:Serine/threonine-protein phosphatase n=1 Tax=Thalassomonas viridans TaxID=137584 RepID=A0AAE9YXM2_9GAMM|nr:protein phosphatase 2C domain-containing protein [Thalassomonas viridans]WDE02875.1 serine/threonine-protein phosphatase [Thalassomonas viridans]